MNLKLLLEKQKELDTLILKNAGITEYPEKEIKLALMVELGELANEWQGFKYWKKNKKVDRNKLLEEHADCLHFALSLENELHQTNEKILNNASIFEEFFIKGDYGSNDALSAFNIAYEFISNDTASILVGVIGLGICLDISLVEMEQAYLKKYEKNLERQAEGY